MLHYVKLSELLKTFLALTLRFFLYFSPSLIALSSKDPILTAFELSWELRRLSFAEHEFKSEYLVSSSSCKSRVN